MIKSIISLVLLLSFNFLAIEATPSTVFWTVCTTDVYAQGTGHIDQDNYFTVFNKRGKGAALPADVGFELGIFSYKDLSIETGIDYLGGANDPLYFNIGAGVEEEKLFNHSPGVKIGFFNAGTRYHGCNQTNFNIVDVIIGKTLPESIGGRVCVAGFSGNRSLGKNRQGFMVSYQRSFLKVKSCDDKEYYKWVFCCDYASGKNVIGGGGIGLYYYFTPDISIVSGPVWYNTNKYNGPWMWSVQIDMSFTVF